MRAAPPQKEKLFRRFKGGEERALAELLEGERVPLFDYLLRMTGQVSKSTDTADEVFQSLNDESLAGTGSYLDLKLLLLTTARRFTADVWNADTSKLTNAALDAPADGQEPAKAQRERLALRPLDRNLANLPGPQREVVLLRTRAGLDWNEIADVMGMGGAVLERTYSDALALLGKEAEGLDVERSLAKLPAHPEPARSSQRTINLSMVMQGIKAKPVGLWSFTRLVAVGLVLAFAALVVALIAQPDLAGQIAAAVKALLSEDRAHGP